MTSNEEKPGKDGMKLALINVYQGVKIMECANNSRDIQADILHSQNSVLMALIL